MQMGSSPAPLVVSAPELAPRESRISGMLKDHKATLSAILEAAKQQALRHKQPPNCSGEWQDEEACDVEKNCDLDSEFSERTLESCSKLRGGQGGNTPEQQAAYTRDDSISYSSQLGMASLSSSGTYTPGQLSGGSFPSAFPSPLPINKDNPQPSDAVKSNSAAPSSLPHLPFPPTFPTEALHNFPLFAPQGANAPLPQNVNAPPLGSWPWLSAGSGVAPSPYEIALMYLQGGGPAAPVAAPLPQSSSYAPSGELGIYHRFSNSQPGNIYGGQPGSRGSAEFGLLKSAEQRGQGSRPGTGASLCSVDEGERGWELAPAYVEAPAGKGARYGGADTYSAEIDEVDIRRSRGGVQERGFQGTGVGRAGDWEAEADKMRSMGASFGPKVSFDRHDAEEESTTELRGDDFGGGVSKGRARTQHNPEANGGFSEERVASGGLPSRSHELIMGNNLDERPLPRASAYAESPSPSKPGASAVIHIPAPSNTPQTSHDKRLSKRPFLKRGSRLLKSVIPRKGEKESWVAEFKGKIAAVPRAIADLPMEAETGEDVDWGLLNAQRVTGKRIPPPVSKPKKVVPQKMSRMAAKEEPLVKRGGTFLRAGSRGGRSVQAQSSRWE